MDIEMRWTLTVYLTTFIISSFFAFGITTSKNKEITFCCRIFLFLTMLIPVALRYDLGADYSSYVELYETGKYIGYSEPGFNLICNFFKYFNMDSFWMFLTVSFMTYFILAFKIEKKDIFTFIVFYFLYTGYFRSLDQIRQALALPFIILGMKEFIQKKYIRFFIFILLAAMFHSSSYVFFLLVPLSLIPLNRKIYFVVLPLLIFFIMKIDLQQVFFNIIGVVLPKYMRFVETETGSFGSGLGLLIKISFPIAFIFFCKDSTGEAFNNRELALSKNFCMFYILIYFLMFKMTIFNRLRDVVWVGVLYAVPKSQKYMNYYNILKVAVLFLGIALFIKDTTYNCVPGTTEISPYRTIFEKYN